MRTKIVAKAVIFNADNEILLLTRSASDDRRPGEQDYPGGGIEEGEDISVGLCREISEEAGIVIEASDLKLFYSRTEIIREENVVRLLFYSRVPTSDVTISFEHDDFQWLAPNQAMIAFPHPFYGEGLKYGLDNGLFDRN